MPTEDPESIVTQDLFAVLFFVKCKWKENWGPDPGGPVGPWEWGIGAECDQVHLLLTCPAPGSGPSWESLRKGVLIHWGSATNTDSNTKNIEIPGICIFKISSGPSEDQPGCNVRAGLTCRISVIKYDFLKQGSRTAKQANNTALFFINRAFKKHIQFCSHDSIIPVYKEGESGTELPWQSREQEHSESKRHCSPDPPRCASPHVQKYDRWRIFSSAPGPKQAQVKAALRRGLINTGTALRKPGSWPGREIWLVLVRFSLLAKILMGALPPSRKTPSWNSHSTSSPEVNHEVPDKKRRELKKFLSQWYLGFLNIVVLTGYCPTHLMGSLNAEIQEVLFHPCLCLFINQHKNKQKEQYINSCRLRHCKFAHEQRMRATKFWSNHGILIFSKTGSTQRK